jgi:hypothetical protein
MRFPTQYTPTNPLKGPPSPEMKAKMGAFMQTSIKSGVLIATGVMMPSAANGMRIMLANGAFDVKAGSLHKHNIPGDGQFSTPTRRNTSKRWRANFSKRLATDTSRSWRSLTYQPPEREVDKHRSGDA